MLSPISPHITEELYQIMFADDKQLKSIHVSQWPKIQDDLIDEDVEKSGDLIVAVMGEIRRDKAENQKPLNVEIKKLTVYTEDKQAADALTKAEEDLTGTCKIEKLEINLTNGQGKEVQGYPKIQFVAEY
jgi:valyl-tRNA synthetase